MMCHKSNFYVLDALIHWIAKINLQFNSLLLLYSISFMLVRQDAVKLLEAFSASVLILIDEIKRKCEIIDETDPDPERTKAHQVDKQLRNWFNKGGYMGY